MGITLRVALGYPIFPLPTHIYELIESNLPDVAKSGLLRLSGVLSKHAISPGQDATRKSYLSESFRAKWLIW